MTTPGSDSDALAATIIQLATHAERLGSLDARETAHHQETATRLRELADQLTTAGTRLSDTTVTLARHSATIDGLTGHIAVLASQVTTLTTSRNHDSDTNGADSEGYQPVPVPRWWKLTSTEREAAIERLRAWVEQIYRPSYGKLAALLPTCWERHPACLYILDWLSELWSLLYLCTERDGRVLAAQAEWHTRLLPAAADLMATEGRACQHTYRRGQPGGPAAVNGPRPY
jgi:hypothetical protein